MRKVREYFQTLGLDVWAARCKCRLIHASRLRVKVAQLSTAEQHAGFHRPRMRGPSSSCWMRMPAGQWRSRSRGSADDRACTGRVRVQALCRRQAEKALMPCAGDSVWRSGLCLHPPRRDCSLAKVFNGLFALARTSHGHGCWEALGLHQFCMGPTLTLTAEGLMLLPAANQEASSKRRTGAAICVRDSSGRGSSMTSNG